MIYSQPVRGTVSSIRLNGRKILDLKKRATNIPRSQSRRFNSGRSAESVCVLRKVSAIVHMWYMCEFGQTLSGNNGFCNEGNEARDVLRLRIAVPPVAI